jgi:methionyl-tRNA formyltransferase
MQKNNLINSESTIVNGQGSIVNHQHIVFFGSGDFVIPVVEKIIDHKLVLAITTEKTGKLVDFLKERNVPFLCSDLTTPDDIEQIKSLKPTVGILASYGAFLPDSVIDSFPNGILNIHPSLLPKYKGSTPIQTAILNGEKKTGISIIKLDSEIDHGPILDQVEMELNGNETSEELLHDFFAKGASMIEKIIDELESGKIPKETPQNHEDETFTDHLDRASGRIDLQNPPEPEVLDRMIRAYYPWPGVWFQTRIKNKELRIKLLPNNMIQVEGKNPVNFKDFINGYPEEGNEILKNLGIL